MRRGKGALHVLFWLLLVFCTFSTALQDVEQGKHQHVARSSTTTPGTFVLGLVENKQFKPTAMDLLSDAILKFGLFKNYNLYPELNATVNNILGRLPLLGGIVSVRVSGQKVKRSRRALPRHQTREKRTPAILGVKVLDPLLSSLGLGADLSLGQSAGSTSGTGTTGASLDLNLGLIDVGVNVNLNLFGNKTWVDEGFGGTTVARLSNSASDNAWFAKIAIGTPNQTLLINIDSGSADTTAYDSSCSTCQLNNHTAFVYQNSSTFRRTGNTFTAQYGDGTTLSGYLGKESLSLTSTLNATSQLIALINKREGGSATHAWDGVMGIGPDQLSYVEGNVTPLSNMIKANKLKAPLVGIVLKKAATLEDGGTSCNAGEYRWGEINTQYTRTPVVYTPVISSYFWGTALSNIIVNGETMFTSSSQPRALFDTGTTLIYTSDYSANAIHQKIPGSVFNVNQGVYYVPCSPASNSPNVFFVIGGLQYGVPAADIAFRSSGKNDGLCVSGIQGGAEDFTLLGNVFIKNVYLVLNYGNKDNYQLSVGLAYRNDLPILL